MEESEEQEIHAAVDRALNDLAEHLGGTTDTGGPVENATQIKGRGELGVLLTDVKNRVLGRVWLAFGAAVQVDASGFAADLRSRARGRDSTPNLANEGGHVHVEAEVCSEIVEPPISVDEWLAEVDARPS